MAEILFSSTSQCKVERVHGEILKHGEKFCRWCGLRLGANEVGQSLVITLFLIFLPGMKKWSYLFVKALTWQETHMRCPKSLWSENKNVHSTFVFVFRRVTLNFCISSPYLWRNHCKKVCHYFCLMSETKYQSKIFRKLIHKSNVEAWL